MFYSTFAQPLLSNDSNILFASNQASPTNFDIYFDLIWNDEKLFLSFTGLTKDIFLIIESKLESNWNNFTENGTPRIYQRHIPNLINFRYCLLITLFWCKIYCPYWLLVLVFGFYQQTIIRIIFRILEVGFFTFKNEFIWPTQEEINLEYDKWIGLLHSKLYNTFGVVDGFAIQIPAKKGAFSMKHHFYCISSLLFVFYSGKIFHFSPFVEDRKSVV